MPSTPGYGSHHPPTVLRPLSPSSTSSDAPLPPPAPPLPPPPAPPLPSQQRYVQRAATAFGRLAQPFLYGSRPSSAQGHRDARRQGPRGVSGGLRAGVRRSSSPVSSRSTAHKTGIPIAALDISPERTHAVLAGRDILKTIKITDANSIEDFNLRSKLSTYASAHNASRDAISAQHRDQLAANDVKWSRGVFSSTIATAAANGRIVIYDLNRPSVEIGRLHEHSRQVHRIAFNPHQGALLISGSQDGTVRMWDMRDLSSDRAVRVSGSIKKFYCHSDGVRDLRWSPTDGVEFAVGTDSGAIQRWDFRRENAPLLKLNAHDKTCLSLDWHPGGRYLASGSADKLVKIWDFKSNDRRMKPNWQLRAPQGVSKIRWRPTAAGAGDESQDHRQVTCLATSYDARDPRIHIWDFRRPHVPFQEVCKYDSMPTDLLWHSEDLLWSVNMGGIFTQADIKFAPTTIERLNTNVLTAGPDGRLCYFSDHRPRKQASVAEAKEQFLSGADSQNSSGEKLLVSMNPADGSGEDAFAISSSLKIRRQRLASNRMPSHASATSSIVESDSRPSLKSLLDPIYQSTQIPASGRILGVFDVDAFKILAHSYTVPSWRQQSTTAEVIEVVRTCFEHNALLAAQTGQYRLAQTWSILGHAACSELKLRMETAASQADLHKRSGVKWMDGKFSAFTKDTKDWAGGYKPATLTSPLESSSSMATPLARPIRGKTSISSLDTQILEPSHKPTKISFVSPTWQDPEASDRATTPQSGKPSTKTEAEPLSPSFSSFPDMEQQMQERRNAMNNYRAKPRSLLRLDDPAEEARSPLAMPRFDRHDSAESLQMFSGSQDSDPRSVPFVGSFDESQKSDASAVSFGSPAGAGFELHRRSRQPDLSKRDSLDPPSNEDESTSLQLPFASSLSHLSPSAQSTRDETASSLREVGLLPVKRPSTALVPTVLINRSTFEGKEIARSTTSDVGSLFGNMSPPRENSAPWTLPALLPPLLDFHLDTLSDTQLPSLVTLSLYQFFPSLFPPLFRCHSYLLAYHEQLNSLRLYADAASLRKVWHPFFPDLAAEATAEQGRGTDKDKASLWCEECARPVKGNEPGWCKRCCTEWADCSVCEMPEPPALEDLGMPAPKPSTADEPSPHPQPPLPADATLWLWCQGCGHGGHSMCLTAWWRTASAAANVPSAGNTNANTTAASAVATSTTAPSAGALVEVPPPMPVEGDPSEGACPVPGCTHDCAPGARRNLHRRELERRKARASTVVKDDWVASESRAVGSATKSLSLVGGKGKAGKGAG